MESDRGRHHWTRPENKEQMFCYYMSRPNVRGFRKQQSLAETTNIRMRHIVAKHLFSMKYLDCENPRKFLWFQLLLVHLALFLLICPAK